MPRRLKRDCRGSAADGPSALAKHIRRLRLLWSTHGDVPEDDSLALSNLFKVFGKAFVY